MMDDTKAWLRRVRELDDEIAIRFERAMRLRAELECPRSVLSDMPRCGGTKDWAETAGKLLDMERELDEVIDALIAHKREVEGVIAQLPDERMREVMRLRYIELRRWDVIIDKLGCGRGAVFYAHGLALQSISGLRAATP
jgi:hypothetical protein